MDPAPELPELDPVPLLLELEAVDALVPVELLEETVCDAVPPELEDEGLPLVELVEPEDEPAVLELEPAVLELEPAVPELEVSVEPADVEAAELELAALALLELGRGGHRLGFLALLETVAVEAGE